MDEEKEARRVAFRNEHPEFEKPNKRKSVTFHTYTVEELLKIGREYAEKGSLVLAKELHLSPSQIGSVVRRLRKSGVPIASRPSGPWAGKGAEVWKEAVGLLKGEKK